MLTIQSLFGIVVAVFALTLGVFILAGDPPNRTNQALFLFSFGIALSSLAKTFFRGQMDVLPLILMRWGFMIMVLGLFCFIHFFPAGKLSERFLLELIPWFVLFPLLPMLCIIALLTPFPIRYFWQAYFASFPIFAAVMGYYIVDGFWYGLLRRRSTNSNTDRYPFSSRALAIVVAFSASVLFVSDLILPRFGIQKPVFVSNLFALAILVLGGGLVARYGTLRNRALLQKGISYTCSLFALAVIFFTIEFGIEKFFYQNDEVVDIFAALVGALVFRPLQNFFNKETNRFFFRSPYPIFAAMEELGDKLNIATDPDVLCRAIGGFLGVTIQPTETAFFRVNGDQQNVALISGLQASDTVINDYLVLASLVLKRAGRKMIMVDEERLFYHHAFLKPVSHDPIQERAKQLGVAVIVPIAVRDHFWMIMMLGCKCSGALFDDNDRELLGFVARRAAITFENIELRCAMELQSKKVEERVMKQTEHLRKIYKSQSQFLTDVSHEFKTPLAVLKMHASVFAESKDVQQKKAWYVMDTTLDRLNRLVGNLLDAAQPNGAPKCPCRTRVAVDELLGETCDDCMILAEDQGINLLFTSEQIAVCGEKDKLKEVVLNLLSNALRHTPSGGTISISACARDGQAEITVRDTGTGISCKNLPHVFERFYRIGEGTLTGTGIGLYLCRQIIESHGGTVTAESEEGKGSCFVVRLPLVARVPPGS